MIRNATLRGSHWMGRAHYICLTIRAPGPPPRPSPGAATATPLVDHADRRTPHNEWQDRAT